MADRTEQIILDFEVDIEDSIESIDSLTKANKELRKERNALDIQSAAGKKRAAEINALLDQNTNKIKTNISALERQKINIGNYASALDNVIPGLSGIIDKGSSATKTINGMSVATKLLLGPIGLLIAAGAAIIKWLTGSEEGMDKLAIVMAKVSAVFNVVVDRVIQLGGALVKFLSGDFSGGIDGIKKSFSGMGDEMSREIDLAVDLAERLDILDDLNLSLRIRLSEQENVIKNLIIQSRNRFLSEEQRMKLLVEAANLEKRLTGERLALRLAEINAIASEIQLRNSEKQSVQQAGETTIQFAKRIAADNRILLSDREKIADQLDQYNGLLDNQANIQEKIQTQQDAISDKIAENLREQEALRRATERAQNTTDASTEDPLKDAFPDRLNTELQLTENFNKRIARMQKEAADEAIRQKRREAEARIALEQHVADATVSITAGFLSVAASMFDEQSEEYKAIATFQTLISTYSAAQKAYEAAFLPIPTVASPGLGVAYAALAVAQGLARVAQINGVEFWTGGYTGHGSKHDPAGVVHKGEVVWNQEDVAAVGGPTAANAMRPTAGYRSSRGYGFFDGGLVANSITQPINQGMELMNFIKHMPAPEVSVKEISTKQRRVKVKEKISKR